MVSRKLPLLFLLTALVVSAPPPPTLECPVTLVDACADEKDAFLCRKPLVDPAPPFTINGCDPDYALQVRVGNDRFQYFKKFERCVNEMSIATTIDGLKLLDVDYARCVKEVCRVNAIKSTGKCAPAGHCQDAKRGPEKFSCAPGFHLEKQDPATKAWMKLADNKCIGDTLSTKVVAGSAFSPEPSPTFLRCRKDRTPPASCDVKPYYDKNECNRESICTQPDLAGTIVNCKPGSTLQTIFDDWMDIPAGYTTECHTDKSIILKKGSSVFDLQLLRCRENAVCGVTPSTYDHGTECPKGDTCTQLTKSEKALVCSDGIIEGFETASKPWTFIEKIDCFIDKIYPYKGGKDDPTKYAKLRCHKSNKCKMDKMYDGTLCASELICEKPDDASYNCKTGFTLEYFNIVTSPQVWTPIASIECDNNQFKVHIGGKKSDIVPLGFRCMKKRECVLTNYDPATCDPNDECQPPQLANKQLACPDTSYELQALVSQWSKAQISCTANALKTKIGGVDVVIASARCVRKNIKQYYDKSDCDQTPSKFLCAEPTGHESMKCDPNYELQEKTGGNWKKANSIAANSDKFSVDGNVPAAQPDGIRCVRMNLDFFNDKDPCDQKHICQKATYDTTDGSKVTCDPKFALQVKITGADWKDVKTITGNSDKFTVKNMDDSPFSDPPESIRCVRMNAASFYKAEECTESEDCKPAVDGDTAVTCDPASFALQVKTGDKWIEVKSISGKSHKFKVMDMDDNDLTDEPVHIRCARLGCSTCSDPSSFLVGFVASTKWNECATFGCGPHSRTVIGTEKFTEDKFECHPENKEGEFFWKKTDGSKIEIKEQVKCEKLCTPESPLESKCDQEDYLCEEIKFDDDNVIKCDAHLLRTTADKKVNGTQLQCNLESGEWELTTQSGKVKVEKGENVYCEYDNCKIGVFCPECKEASPNLYRCPEGTNPFLGVNEDPSPAKNFTCKKSKWMDDSGNKIYESDFPVKCVTKPDVNSSAALSTASSNVLLYYLLAIIFVIILITILIAYIVCRLKGNGWIHTMIWTKMHGGKKKGKKEKNDKKKGSKATTPGGDSSIASANKGDSKYTEKESSAEPEGAPGSAAEPVLPSGEKVSAEGLSVTGASADKFSSELTGGPAIPGGPNEPANPNAPNAYNA